MFEDTNAIEQRARRAAKRIRLIAKKSRWRAGSIDNRGGFMLIEPYSNGIVKWISLRPECARHSQLLRARNRARAQRATAPAWSELLK